MFLLQSGHSSNEQKSCCPTRPSLPRLENSFEEHRTIAATLRNSKEDHIGTNQPDSMWDIMMVLLSSLSGIWDQHTVPAHWAALLISWGGSGEAAAWGSGFWEQRLFSFGSTQWPCQCHYFSSGESGRIRTAQVAAETQLTTKSSQLDTFPCQSVPFRGMHWKEAGLSFDTSHTSLTPVFPGAQFPQL